MAEDEDDSKPYEPSQRRLDKAREEGDVVRSEELQAAAATGGLLLALALGGGWAVRRAGEAGMAFLDRPDLLSGGRGAEVAGLALRMAGLPLLLLAGPAVAVLVWLIASRGLVFAPSRLHFKTSRLSPLANAGQKFGRAGLVDFARRALKMLVIALILGLYLRAGAGLLFQTPGLDTGPLALLLADRILGFLGLVFLVTALFGGADYLWQSLEFRRRHRMSRKDMTDEMKDSEGDPQIKADRRRRAREIANRKMLVDVPRADVVLVNPTHYAVALRWDRGKGKAPVCVAKGVDEMAAQIRRLAQEAGVPIRRDPPTARLLHATLEVGQEIRREHYAAVAAAIRFADAMRQRAGKRSAS